MILKHWGYSIMIDFINDDQFAMFEVNQTQQKLYKLQLEKQQRKEKALNGYRIDDYDLFSPRFECGYDHQIDVEDIQPKNKKVKKSYYPQLRCQISWHLILGMNPTGPCGQLLIC